MMDWLRIIYINSNANDASGNGHNGIVHNAVPTAAYNLTRQLCSYCSACGVRGKVPESVWTSNRGEGAVMLIRKSYKKRLKTVAILRALWYAV